VAGKLKGHTGGIRRLLELIQQHGSALEYDLIRDGLRLRDCPSAEFTWRDLHVYVKHLPPDSATVQAVDEKFGGWTRGDRLLAIIANMLRLLWWAKTKDGHKGRRRPAMIGPDMGNDVAPRAGMKPKSSPLSVIKAALGLDKRPETMSEVREQKRDEDAAAGKIAALFGG